MPVKTEELSVMTLYDDIYASLEKRSIKSPLAAASLTQTTVMLLSARSIAGALNELVERLPPCVVENANIKSNNGFTVAQDPDIKSEDTIIVKGE